jgi:hypothetical protein
MALSVENAGSSAVGAGAQILWQTPALMLAISQWAQSLAVSAGPVSTAGIALIDKARACVPTKKASRKSTLTTRVVQYPRIWSVCDH